MLPRGANPWQHKKGRHRSNAARQKSLWHPVAAALRSAPVQTLKRASPQHFERPGRSGVRTHSPSATAIFQKT